MGVSRLAQRTFDFVDAVSTTDDTEAIRRLLVKSIRRFGLRNFIVCELPIPGTSLRVHLCDWPDGFLDLYKSKNRHADDPIARHARERTEPFAWREVDWDHSEGSRERRFMDEAASFGLEDGFAVPVIGVLGEQDVVSVSGPRLKLQAEERGALHLMCVHAHHAARNHWTVEEEQAYRPDICNDGVPEAMSWEGASEVAAQHVHREGNRRHASWSAAQRWGSPLSETRAKSATSTRSVGRRLSASRASSRELVPHPDCRIHVVTAENRSLYRDELEAIFRLRHAIYADQRGWDMFRRADGRQVDRYDTDEAIYLIAIESGRGVVGGCRLFPTTGPALLQEWAGLAGTSNNLPRSPEVFHFSRLVVAGERREGALLNRVACTILTGLQEYALSENIQQLCALSRIYWHSMLLQLGWNPQPLMLPQRYMDHSVILMTVDISEVAHRKTRLAGGIKTPVLVRRGITRPAVTTFAESSWLS